MKYLKLISLFLFSTVIGFGFSACSENDDDSSPDQPENEDIPSYLMELTGLTGVISTDDPNYIFFNNAVFDDQRRLLSYKNGSELYTYEYSSSRIINQDGAVYSIKNGVIASKVYQISLSGLSVSVITDFKYDSQNRITQLIKQYKYNDGRDTEPTYVDFSWNSNGDLTETRVGDGDGDYIHVNKYEYYNQTALIAPLSINSSIDCAFCEDIDPFLLSTGFFGKSMPKHCLKSLTYKDGSFLRYRYSFDSKGRIEEMVENYIAADDYSGYTDTYVFTWK